MASTQLPEEAGKLGLLDAERVRLEGAHDELSTALIALRANVALIRLALPGTNHRETSAKISAHLDEMGIALGRLESLSREMSTWEAR